MITINIVETILMQIMIANAFKRKLFRMMFKLQYLLGVSLLSSLVELSGVLVLVLVLLGLVYDLMKGVEQGDTGGDPSTSDTDFLSETKHRSGSSFARLAWVVNINYFHDDSLIAK